MVTSRAAFRETARTAPRAARIPVEVRVSVTDPFRAYRRARDGTGGFYCATTGGQSGWGYFGVEPASILQIDSTGESDADGSSLDIVETVLADETLVRGDCEVPYPCGLFGWLSYDLVRELESLPSEATDDRNLPRVQFGLYDCVAAWETGAEDTLRVTACPQLRDPDDPDTTYDEARETALSLAESAIDGDPSVGPPPTDERGPFVSSCGREAFAERVDAVKGYIRDGDTFQANISQRLEAPASVHPVTAFDALRQVNPAPYSALVEFPGVDLVSASPELLLDVDGDHLRTEPIAGTRPRGATPEADDELAAELLSDDKERAEHAMLVDLERNDLGKIAEYGSVEVTDYRRIDRYSEVMHLVSEVTARRRPDVSVTDAIAATFPGGTITGAPKPRTMAIIDELESTRRGPYTGSIGMLGFDERATLNIVIRTLVRHGDEYHLRVGAGIVHDSVPEAEYEETLAKGKALVNAIDEALERETGFSVE
ncbi:aminodeoxychorismate synthase, component I [Haladaptatus sp. AB643]|uniref:aminodeoxychorismate synthase, component I n=1 Tax=Haladaptatus sp. AB643 TaxID=2934174 RepID=UPI00209C46A0|nr:aminodeoxychorismate synthase, component I [Haladaptatus sp. AB643]MCO8254199.1 aminodeoxychorismate synthase, component I [Haladaptatus sp. AB618]